ncbi:PREDICTED: charged multivesicular body protein 6-A [Bactrocera latifrons]|uniref:charged multivesicular body protein 6-A n=1 Tax=Bactrocera latifrons TaxID=174628 RepID=UPI0008DE4C5E|nr:PREDICTED: charged multivesicular body protein 6-A [Bactrocera latifrons]
MGALFAKSKKQSRVTEHDKAVLRLKQQRDKLKQYQKRIELQLEKDRELARKCLQTGRRDRAKLLLRKKKFQETQLINADKQLENLEKMTADLEFAQVELQVIEGLKQGNAALKKVHDLMDINEIEKIMDETREGVEKQQEIDAILSGALSEEDEENVLAELDALAAENATSSLPEVPAEDLPEPEANEPIEDALTAKNDADAPKKKRKNLSEQDKKVLVEA